MEYSVTIARFDQYPADAPTNFAVGFSIVHAATGRAIYMDALVPFAGIVDMTDQTGIAAQAWAQISSAVQTWVTQCDSLSGIVGTPFVPPS